MREDIVAGLRNALERGESLEKAVQSLINAGYNPIEVNQAAQNLSEGAISTIEGNSKFGRDEQRISQEIPRNIIQQSQQKPLVAPLPALPQMKNTQRKTHFGLIIFLIIILLILIGGLIFVIFFGQELIDKLAAAPAS